MRANPAFPRRQRGAVLIVGLLLLLVMTALALTASQGTRLEERMAGNARDLDLAFQASEAGVRAAEERIEDIIKPKRGSRFVCAQRDTCDAIGRSDSTQDYVHQAQNWWNTNAYALEPTLGGVSAKPQFVIEQWADVPDTLTVGSSMQKSGTIYYVATARGLGASAKTTTILETAYATRY
jgi:type IV pilus assembly protein PilX